MNEDFQDYDEAYVSDLIKVINKCQTEDTDYLDMINEACDCFNKEFEREYFDSGKREDKVE